MSRYDPKESPNPAEWLALDEGHRILMIESFHKEYGEYGESLKMHSIMHAVIEAQLAQEIEAVKDAVLRLRKDGLSRHDAIHAIGSVLAEYILEMLKKDESGDVNEEYFDRLSQLTKRSWYAHYEDDA
jgi:hypothetical protein